MDNFARPQTYLRARVRRRPDFVALMATFPLGFVLYRRNL
jgi:hypothetical protein